MFYIAYGSNLNLDQMAFRCPRSVKVCRGVVHGWKLVFKYHADIIETGDPADSVPVLLWKIHDFDWKNLDRYEGFPTYYLKREIPVELEDGSVEKCVAYVMTDRRSRFQQPDPYYFNIIEEGCIQNEIDVDCLYQALDESCHALENSEDVYINA